MEKLLQPEWFSRYWFTLMLENRTLWIAIAVVAFAAFVIMKSGASTTVAGPL